MEKIYQLISRLVSCRANFVAHIIITNTPNRIVAKKEGMKVIDVDGSYLARKHQLNGA